jgi:hypothetical protein
MANLKMKLAAALNRANGPEPKLKKSSSSMTKSNASLSNPFTRKSNMGLNTPSIKRTGMSSYTPSTVSPAVNNVTTPTSAPQKTIREKRKEMKSNFKSSSANTRQENKLKKLESKLENKTVIKAARDKKKADIIAGERERGLTGKIVAGTGAASAILALAEATKKAFSKNKNEE